MRKSFFSHFTLAPADDASQCSQVLGSMHLWVKLSLPCCQAARARLSVG